MGQWKREAGAGRIYLVEDIDDVAALEIEQPQNLAYTTQTTLSVDDTRGVIEALRAKFPAMQGPKNDDICYATQNRQDAVRELAARVRPGAGGRLAQQLQLQPPARAGRARGRGGLPDRRRRSRSIRPGSRAASRIGVTAGASAPDVLVRGVIERLRELGAQRRARARRRARGHGVRAAEGTAAAAGRLTGEPAASPRIHASRIGCRSRPRRPCRTGTHAGIAQLVERRIRNAGTHVLSTHCR